MNKIDSLPKWDLNDLYSSKDDFEICKDLDWLAESTNKFYLNYNNQLNKISAENLLIAIKEYDVIEEKVNKLLGYSYLLYSTNLDDKNILKFFQDIQEKIISETSPLVFFTIELNHLNEEKLNSFYEECCELKQYRPWFEYIRVFKNHLLSNDLERFSHEKNCLKESWIRLYDTTISNLKFELDDKQVSLSHILNQMSSQSQRERDTAAKLLAVGLKEKEATFTLIINTLIKDKIIEDSWRKYRSPISERNLTNNLSDKIVENLSLVVRNYYERLSHRYYNWKAKVLGKDKIEYWDRNAPVTNNESNIEEYSWEEAKLIVLKSYREFSEQLFEIGKLFFEKKWIDALPRHGKESGAFSHPTTTKVHPYILINFYGKTRDVMTLAHELGHGIHQFLSSSQNSLLSRPPLTISETASVFGEMLTFQYLLKNTEDSYKRKYLLSNKIEDKLNTIVRQISFLEFEKEIHFKRRFGELTSSEISEIWLKNQKESLGPSVSIDNVTELYWAYVSHFFHAPFYVYSYAFGECLVNSLYKKFSSIKNESEINFLKNKYIDFLKSGNTKNYNELLEPFSLDIYDSNFWADGLDLIESLIEEIEKLT